MMEADGKIDPTFFSTCRLCVSTPGSYQILPQIQLQIKELFDIKVDAYDGLPQLLCEECRGFVTKLHIIRCDYQKKQQELVSLRTKGLRASEDGRKSPEERRENRMVLQNLDFSKLPAVTLLDISKVNQKYLRGPSAELERAAPTPPIVTTTNVELTSAECDTSSAEPQSPIRDSTYRDCSKDDDSHHNADDTNADDTNANDDYTYVNIRQSDCSIPPSSSVCSSSKSSPKKWRRLYVCKFCNRRFPRINDVRFHLSIHHDLITLQSDLRIKPCFIAMNRSDEIITENALINLRDDSKVENSFEHFYIISLHLDADEYKGMINDSDVVRNLRLKRCNYTEIDSGDDTPLKSSKMMLSEPRKLSSPSPSASSLVIDETESTSASVQSADVTKTHDENSKLIRDHKVQIMSMIRRTFSKTLDIKKRKTSELLKSDETAIEYLLNGDGIINVLWTNSTKSHHAEFIISTRSFAPRSGGFYPPPKRPHNFIDLSLMLRNAEPPPPPTNMLEITPLESTMLHMQPSVIQLNQQESNLQPIQSQNIMVASINFDKEVYEQTVSPPLILNQASAADDGPNLNIIDVRSLRNNDIVYISDDEKMDTVQPVVVATTSVQIPVKTESMPPMMMATTSEQIPVNIESMPLMMMATMTEQMPIILNTESLAITPTPPPEASFDVPILSNVIVEKLKTYTAKRRPPLEPQIPVEAPNGNPVQMSQQPIAPIGVKPLPELIPQRSFIKCKPTSLLLPGATMSSEQPPPPESSTLVTLAAFRSALNAQGFQLVEDTKSSEFTTLARYNINLLKATNKVSLMVSLFVCQSNSTTFCIQVTDSRGRIAIDTEPVFYQSQIIKSLLVSEVVKIFKSNAKALSPLVLTNTIKFIHYGRILAGLEPS